MTVRVGVNGFGRIGRNFFRAIRKQGADIDIVAINDLGDLKTMAHLLKYDSVMGTLDAEVQVVDGGIRVDGETFKVLAERDPNKLPWGDLGVDVVVESTGLFTDRDQGRVAPRGGRAAGDRLRSSGRCRRHLRGRRQRRHVRSRRHTR